MTAQNVLNQGGSGSTIISKGKLNLSGFNPLRTSRSQKKSRSSNLPVQKTSLKPRVNPSPHMSIHENHKVEIIEETVKVSPNYLDPLDTRAPPPKAASGPASAMAKLGSYFPLSGFESSMLDSLDAAEPEVVDEYHFSSIRLRRLREVNRKSNHSPRVQPQSKADRGKMTVVLDLDETLIHSIISPKSAVKKAKQDEMSSSPTLCTEACEEFEITLADGERVRVFKRPGLEQFLREASERFELMAYTAGLRQYAEPLLDWLDPERKYFRARLYRDSCLFASGYYVKDLKQVNRDMKRTVLVDNNLCCFLPQLSNGIPISSFYDDPNDDALAVLKNFLDNLDCEGDIRPSLEKSFNLVNSLSSTRNVILG